MLASAFGLFTSCTRAPRADEGSKRLTDEPSADAGSRVPTCVFCDVSREKGFDVVWEDDAFVAFADRSPAARHHMLVVPKRHVESVRTLVPSDASMVQRMAAAGHALLDARGVPAADRRLGFHIPPFNSVGHLHLHVQGLPYKNVWRRAKYPYVPGGAGRHKGWTWFAEVGQVQAILEDGGRVRVGPC
ncbi:HIT-like protein [Phanerochaete sordida]|uniref:HIT-like protein n=1 Tax=Phanerochaete sordida TaxID=48140 RepID=A0A9P3GJ51_9APHY|nr:HIT-like protein [Phanerochaete sordida]